MGRRWQVLLVFLILSVTGWVFRTPSTQGFPPGSYKPDELLVKFAPGADPPSLARAFGFHLHHQTLLGVWVVKVPPQALDAMLAALSHNPQVEYVEPNGIATIDLDPNDPYDNTTCYNSSKSGCVSQWAWGKIQAYAAWDLTTGSSAVRVAVVDTGIDNSHPDLPPVVAQWDFVNNDNNAEDDNGHGTHVAGTIGALTNNGVGVAGMNWQVSLLAAKVLDASGSGTYAQVADGIVWAADNGAKVINLSLGGSIGSTTLKNAVDYAWSKGAVLACAAGNSGSSAKTYPAAYTNCIAVAATDENDNKASFSNYGAKWVDVAAPGVRILSTMPDTPVYLTTQYGYFTTYDALNGTSMATPHVAGLAGLVWATGKCTTNTCVRQRIETNADPIPGTGRYWYWGRINAYRAVSAP